MADASLLVVGCMKAGTTSLHRVLEARDDVRLVGEKEHASFVAPIRARELEGRWFAVEGRVPAEVSTRYTQRPVEHVDVAAAVELLGDRLRVVAMLRDPWDRIISHYRHWVDIGRETRPFSEAVTDPDLGNPYVAFSDYWRQLSPWFAAVGPSRMRVWWLEDYARDALRVESELADLLGLPRPLVATAAWENAANARPALRGAVGRVVRSSAYRRTVRPLLPAALRRMAAERLSHDDRATAPEFSAVEERIVRQRLEKGLARLAAEVPGGAPGAPGG